MGWVLSTERQEPHFYVSVLTDIDARRHYCACLCFNETVAITPSKPVDEEEEDITPDGRSIVSGPPAITHHSIMYAPKCLVLVSRLDYIETFRVYSLIFQFTSDTILIFTFIFQNCLGTIYTVYIESLPYSLETLIGNILGCIQVPPPGGPQVRFSIGAGDKQALQPPLSPSLPITGTCVKLLFQQLGIIFHCIIIAYMKIKNKYLLHFHFRYQKCNFAFLRCDD